MGRTLLTYRILLDQYRSAIQQHTKHLTKFHQGLLQQALSRAHHFADAATYWNHGHYSAKINLSVLFAQYKELVAMKQRVSTSSFISETSKQESEVKGLEPTVTYRKTSNQERIWKFLQTHIEPINILLPVKEGGARFDDNKFELEYRYRSNYYHVQLDPEELEAPIIALLSPGNLLLEVDEQSGIKLFECTENRGVLLIIPQYGSKKSPVKLSNPKELHSWLQKNILDLRKWEIADRTRKKHSDNKVKMRKLADFVD